MRHEKVRKLSFTSLKTAGIKAFKNFEIFFPQMKPEVRAAQAININEEKKMLLKLIETSSPVLLNDLKAKSGLSNKKWDKTIKGLTKNGLAKVNNTDDGLFVELV